VRVHHISAQRMNRQRREYLVRKMLMLGAMAVVLALGAATTYAVPTNSLYAILAPGTVDEGTMSDAGPAYVAGDPGYGYEGGSMTGPGSIAPQSMTEGRSAYLYGDPGYGVDLYVSAPEENAAYPRGRTFYLHGQ
jgi:hypothetical protein